MRVICEKREADMHICFALSAVLQFSLLISWRFLREAIWLSCYYRMEVLSWIIEDE